MPRGGVGCCLGPRPGSAFTVHFTYRSIAAYNDVDPTGHWKHPAPRRTSVPTEALAGGASPECVTPSGAAAAALRPCRPIRGAGSQSAVTWSSARSLCTDFYQRGLTGPCLTRSVTARSRHSRRCRSVLPRLGRWETRPGRPGSLWTSPIVLCALRPFRPKVSQVHPVRSVCSPAPRPRRGHGGQLPSAHRAGNGVVRTRPFRY